MLLLVKSDLLLRSNMTRLTWLAGGWGQIADAFQKCLQVSIASFKAEERLHSLWVGNSRCRLVLYHVTLMK